jgi:hypothetical protein
MYPLLKINTTDNFDEFVLNWESFYAYNPKDPRGNDLYLKNIVKEEFSIENINELFFWKNGMKLSGKKSEIVEDICKEIKLINELKQSPPEHVISLLPKFMNRDGVWQIFLLHIIKPDYYPIFDQHTYRAYQYIKTGFSLTDYQVGTLFKELTEFQFV